MMHISKKTITSILFAALLTACGGQSTTDTANSGTTQKATQTVQTTQTLQPAPSGLLDSLAAVYPNGQLPAANAAQAAKELTQNPAALKLTAQSAPIIAQSNAQNTGAPIQAQATSADYKAVSRIQNTTLTGAYFFTIYDSERTTALASNPNWNLEGPAFWASLAPGTGLNPVHRFRNNLNGSYLYTIYETEKADIQANYASTFFYEGVAWYAQQSTGQGWSPLYRFRNLLNGTYLFSAYEFEKDAIVANYSAVFELEGIAYYVRQDAIPSGASAPGGLYVGYYQEDPTSNPEDPTPGAFTLNLPASDSNYAGSMYFTYVGCQTSNVGTIGGIKSGQTVSGSWTGTVDGLPQTGSYSGFYNSSNQSYSGIYQNAGGKQYRNLSPCIQYWIAPNGIWEMFAINAQTPLTFNTSVAGRTVSWSAVSGATGTLVYVLDPVIAQASGNPVLWQTIVFSGTSINIPSTVALQSGKEYVAVVGVANTNYQRIAFGSRRFTR